MRNRLAVLVVPLLLAGCGGVDPEAAPASEAPTSVTPSASQAAEDRVLKVGETFDGYAATATVAEVANPLPGRPDYVDDLDAVHVGVRVKVCVDADADQTMSLNWSDFALADGEGASYPGSSSSWDQWPPRPQYPTSGEIGQGRCAAGWILVVIPDGAKVDRVTMGDPANPAVEWML